MASSAAGRKNPLTTPPPLNATTAPSFWVTAMGRNVIGLTGATCAGVCFGGYAILHTWGLNKYQSVVQLYKNGFATSLTPEVIKRCQQTVIDMRLKLKNKDMARFFCVYGMDMFNAGSTKFRGGTIVGVPICFSYKTAADIEKNDILVENKPIEWGSDGGMMLQDSLLLSERAQKFAIARELAVASTHLPYVHGGIGGASIMTYVLTTRFINTKFLGHARPKSFRVVVYSLVGTFAFGAWATLTDMVTKYYENYADGTAGKLSLDYARGGVEFYSKILERNMALRSLMGPSGEKRFTFYGNDVEFIRQKHIPFTERKINLESIATKLSTMPDSTEDANTVN